MGREEEGQGVGSRVVQEPGGIDQVTRTQPIGQAAGEAERPDGL
jgi:hypothetical protein